MKALWLSTLLLFVSSVTAQTNSTDCNITLDRDDTVPQLCYAYIQAQFRGRKLNFTVTNEMLNFEPLPENRQVAIQIDENSDGLEAWANLANAFVDSVRSGSLPYGNVVTHCAI